MEPNKEQAVIILAAGLGTRMKSKIAKVLHPIMGTPMIRYIVDTVTGLNPQRLVVVVGHQAEQVKQALEGTPAEFVHQPEQRGTGDAVKCTRTALGDFEGQILIMPGDAPAITKQTLEALFQQAQNGSATILTVHKYSPTGYGRILRDEHGQVQAIIEERDASPEQRGIKEINTGFYCFQARILYEALDEITTNNAQGEYYLTDVIGVCHRLGIPLQTHETHAMETWGINDRTHLARVSSHINQQILQDLMLAGVTIQDTYNTFISRQAKIGRDTTIKPFTIIEGDCTIGEDCVIGPNVSLSNVQVGQGVTIRQGCVIQDSAISAGAIIGPYSHIRPGSQVLEGAHVGNFVELKKTTLGKGSKANHLTYLGDAVIGQGVNIGAGTITCNYDGVNKYQTVIEDGVFIGSDSSLVAPVKIGRGAYVGAGSTITKDVPADALAIARERQTIKPDWAKKKNK